MAKKKRAKPQVAMKKDPNKIDPDPKCQFKVEKAVEDNKKIRPQQVFEGYKVPSGNTKKTKSGKK